MYMPDIDITCIDNDTLQENVGIVMRQTDYTEEIAKSKLQQHGYDTMSCIREYLGVTEKKEPPKVVSVNQQIYAEFRKKLGSDQLQSPQSQNT